MTFKFWEETAKVIEDKNFISSEFSTAGKSFNADGSYGYIVYDDVKHECIPTSSSFLAAIYWDRINRRQFSV